MGKFDNKNEKSVSGKLLVALPALHSSCFEKSVIYMISHDKNGAMGLIINHMLSGLDFSEILKQFKIESEISPKASLPVHFGGPVDMVRGFILHSKDYKLNESFEVGNDLCLTSSKKVLQDISLECGPEKKILALGYAGWTAGQLEKEIEMGSWYTVPATEEIVFGPENADKWRMAAKLAGISDPLMFSHEVGHA